MAFFLRKPGKQDPGKSTEDFRIFTVPDKEEALIQEACDKSGQEIYSFILNAAVAAARKVIEGEGDNGRRG